METQHGSSHPLRQHLLILLQLRKNPSSLVYLLAGVLIIAGSWWRHPQEPVFTRDAVESTIGLTDESRCIECHEEAEQFAETGHARTLFRVDDPASVNNLTRLDDSAGATTEGIQLSQDGSGFIVSEIGESTTKKLSLHWCFGSGEHAQTWVSLLPDGRGATDLAEFRWTWFESINGFDVTPGQPTDPSEGYFQHLGMLYDHPKARNCFACHATYVNFPNGRLDESSIRPNVTCQRCHGPRQAHVDSEGKITDSFWKNATQMESVNRCGQCHRRADERKPEEIRPDNTKIVRFQPVGLIQSKCFKSSPSLTCLTCHDPHRPLSAQDSRGIWQCTQCHDGSSSQKPLCRAGHTDDCLTCHMPKRNFERPVFFTDHWIRIRTDIEFSANDNNPEKSE